MPLNRISESFVSSDSFLKVNEERLLPWEQFWEERGWASEGYVSGSGIRFKVNGHLLGQKLILKGKSLTKHFLWARFYQKDEIEISITLDDPIPLYFYVKEYSRIQLQLNESIYEKIGANAMFQANDRRAVRALFLQGGFGRYLFSYPKLTFKCIDKWIYLKFKAFPQTHKEVSGLFNLLTHIVETLTGNKLNF